MQRQQKEIVATMLIKYIMSCQVQTANSNRKKETIREGFYPSSNPFLHSHASPIYCWYGDVCDVEK